MAPPVIPIPEKFWSKVSPGDEDACWEWHAYCNDYGYGIVSHRGKELRAHRVSWEIHNGPILDGLCVLHECDNPPCVNPNHLFLGTRGVNAADKVRKGRARGGSLPGESNPAAKLKVEDVREIKRRGKRKYRGMLTDLGRDFGVTKQMISLILKGKKWAHVTID